MKLRRPHHQHRPAGLGFGFTLLEVILALALLSLLSGMVFGIVRVAMRTAMETRQVQEENDQLNQFIRLCRHTFQNLPATAILNLTVTQSGTPVQQELLFSGVPECFPFGSNPISYEDSILGLRPDIEASQNDESGLVTYFIGLSREDLLDTEENNHAGAIRASASGLAAPDAEGRYWMPLLPGVLQLTWRFYDETEDIWHEEWDSATLPPLVEMVLLMQDRTYPIRMVFALPSTKLSEANAQLATSAADTSTAEGEDTNSNAGGGNNGNGNAQGRGQGQGQGRGQGRGGDQGGGRGQGGQGNGGQNPNMQNRSNNAQPSGNNAGFNQGARSGGS